MNSFINNNLDALGKRFILMTAIMVGIGSMVFANPVTDEAKLSAAEAKVLISQIKADFDIAEDALAFEEDFEFDEMERAFPIKTIKIYDKNDVLLLEAPICRVEQMANKYLRKLINASDFLIEMHRVSYYRLDI